MQSSSFPAEGLRLRGGGCGQSSERGQQKKSAGLLFQRQEQQIGHQVATAEKVKVKASGLAEQFPALAALDDRLCDLLADGTVRILSTVALLRQPDGWRLKRQQDLDPSLFLSPAAAVGLVRSASRGLGVLSYGWLSAAHPECAAVPRESSANAT